MASPEIPSTSKAWIQTQTGAPPTSITQTTIPTTKLHTATSVLVKVSHASLHPGTSILMHTIPMIFRSKPAVAETDFSGTIVSAGDKSGLDIGDKVFGSIAVPAHLKGAGALAEYVAVEAASVARIPKGASFEEAAALAVSGITAIDVVDAAKLQPGQKVLINAPCGGIGNFATQLVRKAVGKSGVVVGICSARNADLAVELGCTSTVDYKPSIDGKLLTETLKERFPRKDAFDAVVDCHGSQELWYHAPGFLKAGPEHSYATVGPKLQTLSISGLAGIVWQMARNSLTPVWAGGVDRKYAQVASFLSPEKLERLRGLVEEEGLKVHVGHRYRFEQVHEAYKTLLGGHAVGKIVVSVQDAV